MKLQSEVKQKVLRDVYKNFIALAIVLLSIPVELFSSSVDVHTQAAILSATNMIRQNRSGRDIVKPSEAVVSSSSTKFSSALHNSDPKVRRRALRRLGSTKGNQNIDRLKVATCDPDSLVRQTALLALGKIKDPRATEQLQQSIEKDPEIDNRRVAATALGLQGTLIARKVLLELFPDASMPLKLSIGRGLALLGDDSAYALAKTFLKNDDEMLRAEAAQIIGLIGRENDIASLEFCLKDKDKNVQFKCLEGIKQIEYRIHSYPENLDYLKTSLSDASATVRYWAAKLLLDLNTEAGLEILEQKALEGSVEAKNVLVWKVTELTADASVAQ